MPSRNGLRTRRCLLSHLSRARGVSHYEVRTPQIGPRQTRCALVEGARSARDDNSTDLIYSVHCGGS